MKVLAVESSTQACSASVIVDGVSYSRFELAPQKHANLLLPMVESILKEAGIDGSELDLLSFSEGPGAFTGVRIAAGVIQGLAFGWNKPVVNVSTLESLAWVAYKQTDLTKWVACLDARMKEIYCQESEVVEGKLVSSKPILVSQEEAASLLTGQHGVGDIDLVYPELSEKCERWLSAYPTAEAIAVIAGQRADSAMDVSAVVPVPVYLRNNVAHKKKAVK